MKNKSEPKITVEAGNVETNEWDEDDEDDLMDSPAAFIER